MYAAFANTGDFACVSEVAGVADAKIVAVQVETYASLPCDLKALPSAVIEEAGALCSRTFACHCYGADRCSGIGDNGVVLLLREIDFIKDVDRYAERDETGIHVVLSP